MDMGFAFRVVCFPSETPLKRTHQSVVISKLWMGDYVHVSYQHRDTIWKRPEGLVHRTTGFMSSYVPQYCYLFFKALFPWCPPSHLVPTIFLNLGFCEHQGERFDGDILFRILPCLSVSAYCPTVGLCIWSWWTWRTRSTRESMSKGIHLIFMCRQIEGRSVQQ